MRYNKWTGVISLCTAMMVVASGCGGQGGNSSTDNASAANANSNATASAGNEAKEPVELTVWSASREEDAFSQQMEKEFLDAHPYIKLNKVVHEGDGSIDYFQAVAAGNAPDVIGLSYAVIQKYIQAGVVLPLTDYIKDWSDYKNYPATEQARMTGKDGNVYGIVSGISTVQFAYNKKLFTDAGIKEAPKTWEEVLADAKLLTKPEQQQAGLGMLTGESAEWFFQYYVWQAGGDLTKKNDDGTLQLTFADPAAVKAAQYYQQLRKAKVTQSDFSMKFGDMVSAFATGKIAMMPFSGDWVSWAVSLGMKPEDIGLALMPAGPNGKAGLGNIGGSLFAINPNSSKAKQDAAFEYIKFYTSKESLIATLKNKADNGAVNPVPLPRTDVTYADAGITMAPEVESFLKQSMDASRDEFYGKSTVGKYVNDAVQQLALDPNVTAEKVLNAAQGKAEKEALDDFNKQNKG